jgi:predicted Zn-dependent protease with MMP-like domain
MDMTKLEEVAQGFMRGLPEPVIEALTDVELVIAEDVEKAAAMLKEELGDEFNPADMPADCKGVFVGAPTEIEESDESEEEEIVYYPEGFVVLCANNIETESEGLVVLMHEVGHALGMDEEEVTKLGLGVQGNEPGQVPPKEGDGNDDAQESGQ